MVIRFGPFELDAARRQLRRDSADIHLTRKAFDLLTYLIGEAPRVVTKQELHERLWPRRPVTDASLAGLVKELRRALMDIDPAARIIRTAHGVGYALSLEVDRGGRAVGPLHWIFVNGQRIPLARGENLIGRDASAGVCLDVPTVSRRHALITINERQAWLEDCGSKNGTRVGGVRLSERTRLRDGDELRFGRVRAVYRCSGRGMSTETHIGLSAVRSRRGAAE